MRNATTVCQTGFLYGVSALAFLCARTHTLVYSFDIDDHGYKAAAERFLKMYYGSHRVLNTYGNSMLTLSGDYLEQDLLRRGIALPKCDLIFVDGCHFGVVPYHDIFNFRRLSYPGALIIMDDCVPHQKVLHRLRGTYSRIGHSVGPSVRGQRH